MPRHSLTCIVILAGILVAAVATAAPQTITVSEAWTRPAAAGMNAAGYMTISNPGQVADRLDSASSPIAVRTTLHQSRRIGSVSVMRPLGSLPLPPQGRTRLAPGGVHLMLEGLRRGLKPGDRAPVTLRFRRAGAVRVWLAVRGGAPDMNGMRM